MARHPESATPGRPSYSQSPRRYTYRRIETIDLWESTPEAERGDWQYYDHWLVALEKVITDRHPLTGHADGKGI